MAEMMSEMGFDGIEVSCGIAEDGMSSMRGEVPVEAFLDEWPMYRSRSWFFKLLMRWFGRRIVKPPPMTQAFNRAAAVAMRERVDVPLFLVGGITEPAVMEEIVASGDADYVSLCRSLIADAGFPNKIAEGQSAASACQHCNLCIAYVGSSPGRCFRGKRPRKRSE